MLGIDLGANSVGWAALALGPDGEPTGLLHPPAEVPSKPSVGVRIFEEGVKNYEQGKRGETRGKKRRQARLQRRQTERRARRQGKVFGLLQRAGLLPCFDPGASEPDGSLHQGARDQLLKKLDRDLAQGLEEVVPPDQRRTAHETLPYLLRARALDSRLSPYELGRAFYHLAQRRGFLSNRKAGKKDEDVGTVKKGISELRQAMEAAGSRTLGEHLANVGRMGARLRGRWTSRDMYVEEFEKIWGAQAPHHAGVLTEVLHKRLHHALFHQRPLKSQRHLVGSCELENGGEYVSSETGVVVRVKRRRRAPECLLVSQRFRLVQKVNDLAVVDRFGRTQQLGTEQRQQLLRELEVRDALSFAEIKKLLGMPRSTHFNLEAGGEKKLTGNRTNAALRRVFGDRWDALPAEEKDLVVLEIWGAPDDEVLRRRAGERKGVWAQLRVTRSEAEELADISISSEYMGLSRRAMERLLPVMETGKQYVPAVREVYGERVSAEAVDLLPPAREVLDDLRNPVVERALTELRRVVNTLIKYYGIPEEIRVELARDLKRGKEERNRLSKRMRDNERQREKAAERIAREAGIASPTGTDIVKLRLAEECGWSCPYTGRSISMGQLFGGEVDIEHILPLSVCLDDSFLNKTLCFAETNRTEKRNRTPFEAFGADPPRWEEMVDRMTRNVREHHMPPIKLERFQLAGEALENHLTAFKASQLNDTRYASVCAKEYLARLYGGNLSQGVDAAGRRRIVVGNGQATALLRRSLGLEAVLPVGPERKREDHRHHAVDAVAVALTGPATIQHLSSNVDYGKGRPRLGAMPPPWVGFVEDLRSALERIAVSFRIDNRVRGPLHEETLYSPPRDSAGRPAAEGGFVHVRKRLEELSAKQVESIVDPRIRALVKDALNGRSPKEVFLEGKAETYPELPNRNGAPVPVLRARIMKVGLAQGLGKASRRRYVQNAENHHVELVLGGGKKGGDRWSGRVVSLLEAYERRRARVAIIDRGGAFLFSLVKNDTIELDYEGRRALFTIRRFSESQSGSLVFDLFPNTDARRISKVSRQGRTAVPDDLRKRNCRKVVVSPIGVLRPCRA
ncbi:MAG: type II CRISPR RNA-guided endonuclease Cas9 [Planctomycetota bacterium]